MIVFAILAGLIVGSAAAAMLLRRLVHCVLSLTVTFAGLAMVFLHLGAQFVGFAQILVYVGAVAILIVFALLLTRGSEVSASSVIGSSSWLVGVAVAAMVFGCLAVTILSTHLGPTRPKVTAAALGASAPPQASVKEIGQRLMASEVVPLEAAGLLLTAAMIGAAIIALPEKRET